MAKEKEKKNNNYTQYKRMQKGILTRYKSKVFEGEIKKSLNQLNKHYPIYH